MTSGHKPIIGLIGSIGAGKSTVARILADRGGSLIDADALGHQALEVPEIKNQIVSRWGSDMIKSDGSVNRRALAAVVFSQPQERQRLESLVHPEIRRRVEQAIQTADADPAYRFIVLDAALLLEADWAKLCDRIILVDAPPELRWSRVQASRGWTAADLARREQAQWPLAKKRRFADAILNNSGSVEMLAEQVDSLVNSWGLAAVSAKSPC
jgi:dephospho-CoA kinase